MRGVVLGAAHACAQTAVAAVRVYNPDATTLTRVLVLGLVVALALAWGVVDGRHRPGCAMNWFYAGLVAGPLAGLAGVAAQSVLVDATGVEALGTALTGGAAFTALLVAAPALAGMLLGRRPAKVTPSAAPPPAD